MRISAKHEQSVLAYNDFSGGLNFTVGADAIADNQFSVAENVEYGALDGSLTKVAGLMAVLEADKKIEAFYILGFASLIFIADGVIYSSDWHKHEKIGECTGKAKPMIVPFGKELYIASGGKLQQYKKGKVKTIEKSPNCEYVFAQQSRLVVANSESARLTYSGVLDAEKWEDSTDDNSSSKWIDIGDNDAGTIVAIGRLFQDLIIFTSTHKAFRLTGEYPNWRQLPFSKDAYATNFGSVCSAQNSLFFLGNMGFQAVQSTVSYGDMMTVNVGKFINNYLTVNMIPSSCAMWSVPTRWQIWIQPQESGLIYIYHTQTGAFTTRKMKGAISQVIEHDGITYVARGNKILEVREDITTDDGEEIESLVKLKEIRNIDRMVLKRVMVDLYSRGTGEATLSISRLSIPLLRSTGDDIVALDDDIVALDDDSIVGDEYIGVNKRCNYKLDRIAPIISIKQGSLSIRKVNLLVAGAG